MKKAVRTSEVNDITAKAAADAAAADDCGISGHRYVNGACRVCGHVQYWDYTINDGMAVITGYTGNEFELRIPAEGIANRDLCAVLSNALDNAREACVGTAPCTVSVFSRAKESGMVLTVKNPVKSRVPIRGGRIITTKQDKKNHGFGLSNIRTAAERCSGYADISCDDSAFMLEVGLMFGEKMSRG